MISIIITHKKELGYLADCLESVADQKYKDIETILVLDHTEDDVAPLVEKYRDEIKLKVYELEEKTGVSAARNYGLDQATGEFVMFLDNDDYMCGESLQGYMDVMDDTDIAYGQVKNTYFKRESYLSGQAKEYKGEAELLAKLDFNNPINYCIERYGTLNGLTVLGSLYRRELFVKNNIKFDEKQLYYADAEVIARLFSITDRIKGTEDALYVRRVHNDMVNNPSLNQIPKEDTMSYYFMAYENALEAASNEKVRNQLNVILGKFIARTFTLKYRGGKDDRWRGEWTDQLLELAQTISKKVIRKSNMKWYNKKFVYGFMECDRNNKSKLAKKVNHNRIIKKLVNMTKNKKNINKAITLYVFNKMPFKKNWIVFESFMGRNYSGQPKYIYQYLQEHYGNEYKYIWSVDKKGIKIDGKHKTCRRWSLRYYYYMNRSKYWVTNMRQPLSIPKRDETVILSTWHGTPLKRLVFDMEENYSASPKYKNIVYRQTRQWDYMLSDNPYSTDKFQRCFMLDREQILESGYPANDPMYAPDREERAKTIKKKLGISEDKKVIMYAPTWRDDNFYESGRYGFDIELDIQRLKEEFGDEYVLMLRMHYFVVDRFDMTQFGDFVVDVCNYDDITELYLVSDILMTDYSSVFFDFANLKRPMLFFMYDLEKYRDVLHGFYMDIEKDLPGPILRTNDEVVDAIRNIDKVSETYREKYEEFYNIFCCIDDGNASKRVVETVFKK